MDAQTGSGAGRQQRSQPTVSATTVTGYVIDEQSGTGIPGATITIPAIHRITTSEQRGKFYLTGIPLGRQTFTVRRMGYAPLTLVVDIKEATASSDSSNAIVLKLRNSALELSSVTVASDKDVPVGEQLQRSAVLDGSALDRAITTNISSTIASQPGVTQKFNGTTASQPVIRGLSGDRVTVLEDGLKSGDIGGSSGDHALSVDGLGARRIEVIRGPGALLFGTYILGGIVNVVREDVPHSRPERLSYTLSSLYEGVSRGGTISGGVSVPLPSHITAKVDASYGRSNDLRTPDGPLNNTDATTLNLSSGASRIFEHGNFGASIRHYQSEYGVPSAFNGITLPGSHQDGVYIKMARTTGRVEGEVKPRYPFFNLFNSINAQANYTRYKHTEIEEDDHGGAEGNKFGQLSSAGNISAKYRHGIHSGAVGGIGQWRDFRATGEHTGTRPSKQTSFAMFGFHEVSLNRFKVVAGGRLDHINIDPFDTATSSTLGPISERNFTLLTGSIGGSYHPSSDITIGLNAARSARAPAIEELFSAGPHLANYSFEIGNPDLKQETGIGFDAFVRYTTEKASAEITVFRNNIQNFIGYSPLISEVTGLPERDPRLGRYFVYQATQTKANLTGGELSLQYEFLPGLAVDASASTTRGKFDDGSYLPNMPPTRTRIGVRQDKANWFIGGNIESLFKQNSVPKLPTGQAVCSIGGTNTVDSLSPSDYCPTGSANLVNLSGGFRLFSGSILHTISLSVDNVFNTSWRDALWKGKSVAPQPGRNVRLLYRVRY